MAKREDGVESRLGALGRGGKTVSTTVLKETLTVNFEVEGKDRPPFNLDEYVEWSTAHACDGKLGCYQLKVLWLLTTCWASVSANTYCWNFITKEPDIGEVSGRRLILSAGQDQCLQEHLDLFGQYCPDCTQEQLDDYGRQCPELRKEFCSLPRELWEYSNPENSVRAEFDLSACTGGSAIIPTIATFWWAFYSLGVFTAGVVSDKFGRVTAWYVYVTIQTLGAAAMAASSSYLLFAAARMAMAVGVGGWGVCGFVYFTESMNPESVHYLVWVPVIWFSLGAIFPAALFHGLGVVAWRTLVWIVAASSIPWFVLPLFFFESPKWLATKKDRAKIHQVMASICAQNGKSAPAPPPETEYVRTNSKIGDVLKETEQDESQWEQHKDAGGLGELLHPKVLPRLLLTSLTWMTLVMTYYGLSFFDPPELFPASGPLLSWSVGFLLEIPASIAGAWLIEQPAIGRKGVGGGCYAIGAGILGIAALKPLSPPGTDVFYTTCYYVARMFIAAAFGVVYVWSAELFPNSVRNTAMGVNSAAARVGSSLSPWIGEIDNFSVRMLIFAIPGLIVGTLAMLKLPETRGIPLPGYPADLED